jgi:hypothetical protein
MARSTMLLHWGNAYVRLLCEEPVIEEIIHSEQLMLPLFPDNTICNSKKDDLLAIIEGSLAPGHGDASYQSLG